MIKHKAELWLRSPIEELIVDDGRVVGVQVNREGRRVAIGARRGVMLAGGGFDANAEWRQRYHGIDGSPSCAPGNLGRPIEIAMANGAAVELMDDAWWGASVAPTSASEPGFIVGERSFPYSIMVDARGDRFANESESYVDLGYHMLAHDKDGPYWLISERRHSRRYLRSYAMDPKANRAMRDEGVMVKTRSLADLATKIGIEPARLQATVERFNGYARAGVDGDFGRGKSAYDRYYSDLTDADGRALREDGSVIEGLYSAGNNSASVMGRTYPGPGSTIGRP